MRLWEWFLLIDAYENGPSSILLIFRLNPVWLYPVSLKKLQREKISWQLF